MKVDGFESFVTTQTDGVFSEWVELGWDEHVGVRTVTPDFFPDLIYFGGQRVERIDVTVYDPESEAKGEYDRTYVYVLLGRRSADER